MHEVGTWMALISRGFVCESFSYEPWQLFPRHLYLQTTPGCKLELAFHITGLRRRDILYSWLWRQWSFILCCTSMETDDDRLEISSSLSRHLAHTISEPSNLYRSPAICLGLCSIVRIIVYNSRSHGRPLRFSST